MADGLLPLQQMAQRGSLAANSRAALVPAVTPYLISQDKSVAIQHVAMRLNRVAQWMHVNALGHPRRQTISTVMRADR